MKEFLARLNPMERRFVVGVAVAFFIVINAVWVLPLFGKWSDTRKAMDDARGRVFKFEDGISHKAEVERAIAKYQDQNQVVPPEEQAVQFFRTIVNQSTASGVNMLGTGGGARQSLNTNNPYFVEQSQTIQTQSGEKQLVDFLYNIGASSNSLIRVKNLSIQPDPPHQQLSARITLVASYQKKMEGSRAATPASAAPKAATPGAAPKPAAATPNPTAGAPRPPGPGGAVPPGAQGRPVPPNPAGAPKPPINRLAATNKLNNLTPNKK